MDQYIMEYRKLLERKKLQYKEQFDASELDINIFQHLYNKDRVEVSFRNDNGIEYEKKRGFIGITTGWKPCFLLMRKKNSIGSSYTIGKKDKILCIITKY